MSAPVLKTVNLPPIGGRVVEVGVIADSYVIGGNRKGQQSVPIYDHRIIEYIVEKAKNRVKHKFDCPILIAGPRRTGKSTTGIDIARKLDPNFTVDHIAFRLDDFREILRGLPAADPENGIYPVALLDEAGTSLYKLDYMQKMQKEMVKIFQVIGKKRLTMVMCLPHRNFLTRDIREQMYIWIQTRTLDEERGFAELREGVDNIWNLDLYWKPLCGFVYNELDDPFWHEYERKKDAFIDEFSSGSSVPDTSRMTHLCRQRDALIKLVASKKLMPRKDLADLTDMRTENVTRIINSSKK